MEKTICFFIVIIILALDCRGIVGYAGKDIKTLPTRSKRVAYCIKSSFVAPSPSTE